MPIDRISVKNFKSYRDLDVKLGPLNVFIGANASGKSNFLQIFRFFRDLVNYDLENAVSMQGGIKYLGNLRSDEKDIIGFDISISHKYKEDPFYPGLDEFFTIKDKIIPFRKASCSYSLNMEYNLSDSSVNTPQEECIYNLTLFTDIDHESMPLEIKNAVTLVKKDKFKCTLTNTEYDDINNILEEIKKTFFIYLLPSNLITFDREILIKEKNLTSWLFDWPDILGKLKIYDVKTSIPKQSIPITGKLFLEEDGSNLAIVLKNILEDEEKKRKFLNLVKFLLPFIENFKTEKFMDKSYFFQLNERFSKEYIPASLVSDGTINLIAMIIILYFEKSEVVIIEEPERNIHPKLISGLIEMAKEASQHKQIIMTTHNPQIIRHVDLDSIYLVSRDKKGNSIITKPADDEQVQSFLKNELGIDELFVDDLLGGGSGV